MLVVPLSSCSARLPVYVLLTAVVFDPDRKLLGFLAPGALALFAMYVLSVVFSLGAAFVIGRTVLKGPRPTLVLELPVYRMPRPFNVARATWQRVRRFLVDAGTIILALTIVLWGLLNYPRNAESVARFEAMRAATAAIEDESAKTEQLAAIDAAESGDRPRNPDAALPERHLGLLQAAEIDDLEGRLDRLADALSQSATVDLPKPVIFEDAPPPAVAPLLAGQRIAIARDLSLIHISEPTRPY